MTRFLLLLLITFSLAVGSPEPAKSDYEPTQVDVVLFGDSISARMQDKWNWVPWFSILGDVSIRNEGEGGWAIDDLLDRKLRDPVFSIGAELALAPGVVILEIGSNDLLGWARRKLFSSKKPASVADGIVEVIGAVRDIWGISVPIIVIPPWETSDHHFGYAAASRLIRERLHDVPSPELVKFVDTEKLFRSVSYSNGRFVPYFKPDTLRTSDRVHLNFHGYWVWIYSMECDIRNLLDGLTDYTCTAPTVWELNRRMR